MSDNGDARPLHVITGAGSGIGAALAVHAALEVGAAVAVVDVDAGRAAHTVETITAAGGAATTHAVDVADYAEVERLAEELHRVHGSAALVACNAGIEYSGPLWEMSPEAWERVRSVNLDGAFNLTRALLPAMIASGSRSSLLYTSSIGGVTIAGNQTAYVVSKHAVRVLAQSVACDLEAIGSRVGVSILLPGPVRTRIFEDSTTSGGHDAEAHRAQLLARLRDDGLNPEEVARIAYDGVAAGRRWIYTDPDGVSDRLRSHVEELLSGVGTAPDASAAVRADARE
jgi:NAD(P)-dependent dehydrogenase (short-subunit alcohol dehydrogenase family)